MNTHHTMAELKDVAINRMKLQLDAVIAMNKAWQTYNDTREEHIRYVERELHDALERINLLQHQAYVYVEDFVRVNKLLGIDEAGCSVPETTCREAFGDIEHEYKKSI